MDEQNKKRAAFLVDWAIKLRSMMLMDDEFLRFVSDIEGNPSPANLERIEKWNAEAAACLARRAEQACQPAPESQPESIQNSQFVN